MLDICPDEKSLEAVNVIENKYNSKKILYMCKYFKVTDAKDKCAMVDKFKLELINLDIFSILQNIFMKVKKDSTSLSLQDKELLKKWVSTYNANNYQLKIKKNNYKICPNCKIDMTLFSQLSEIRCPECPYVMRLDGSEFDNVESKYNNSLLICDSSRG